MGADLIIARLATKRQLNELDWEAGKRAIDALPNDLLDEAAWELPPDEEPDDDALRNEVRERFKDQLDELKAGIDDCDRTVDSFSFGAWLVIEFGGTSWGDSPGETFDAIATLGNAPQVLEAVGFGWPEDEHRAKEVVAFALPEVAACPEHVADLNKYDAMPTPVTRGGMYVQVRVADLGVLACFECKLPLVPYDELDGLLPDYPERWVEVTAYLECIGDHDAAAPCEAHLEHAKSNAYDRLRG